MSALPATLIARAPRLADRHFLDGLIAGLRPPDPSVDETMVEFIDDALGGGLWGRQREIVAALDEHPRIAVRSCHGAGKSHVASRIVIAYLQTHPHSIVITTAPTARQVDGIMWRYIRQAAADSRRALLAKPGHPLQRAWEIQPDWYALGFKAGDGSTDAFQGFHSDHMLVVVDEAAGVAEPVFGALEAILTGKDARMLMIGNPTSSAGTFRRAFHEQRELWHTITVGADATPNFTSFGITRADMESGAWEAKLGGAEIPFPSLVDPRWVARQIALHGADNDYVLSRVWGEFPRGGEFTLIALSDIELAEGREALVTEGRVCVGIDVARYGADETVIWVRQGEETLGWDAVNGFNLDETAGRLPEVLARMGLGKADVEVRVDATGLGGGLVDILEGAGWDVVGVNFGGASSDTEQWPNMRHELWWQLAERFREGRIGIAAVFDEVTKGQLSDVHYAYSGSYTKPVIESKEAARKRGRKSPDRAEAMMLAYAVLHRAAKVRIGPGSLGGGVVKAAWNKSTATQNRDRDARARRGVGALGGGRGTGRGR